ncbi:hypothetical protein J6590_016696 [Homalodisca vitripennis]|nr:hypothetical protein J6590_016696 [Homalodisca vitripennis]
MDARRTQNMELVYRGFFHRHNTFKASPVSTIILSYVAVHNSSLVTGLKPTDRYTSWPPPTACPVKPYLFPSPENVESLSSEERPESETEVCEREAEKSQFAQPRNATQARQALEPLRTKWLKGMTRRPKRYFKPIRKFL